MDKLKLKPEPLCLSPDDAGAAIGIGRTMVWELLRSGEIPSFMVGRRRLITHAALAEFVRRKASEPAGGGAL